MCVEELILYLEILHSQILTILNLKVIIYNRYIIRKFNIKILQITNMNNVKILI